MEIAIRHHLPGRVRLHVPDLCRRPQLAETAGRGLRAQPGITGARLNEACASLVIEYDPAREPLLEELLAYLEAVSAKQLTGLIAGVVVLFTIGYVLFQRQEIRA